MNGSVLRCTRSANFILAFGVSTTSPSTPAVKRPALRSVTRRTLTSVFARDRSINFCRLRTRLQVACLRRREDPLPQTPYALLTGTPINSVPGKDSSSGPFAAATAAASNLSFGSGVSIIFLFTGSPDRVSTLSGPGTQVPYPAGYP